MREIKKINKNYYKIYFAPTCSVFVDEELSKKVMKLLYKYKNELDTILSNNKEHTIKEEWSLAYPNGKQESFYGTNLDKPSEIYTPKIEMQKVENLFFIGEENIYSDEVKNKISELLELELNEDLLTQKP